MPVVRPVVSPIDDFLDQAGRASQAGRWESLGVAVSLAGAILAVGVVVLVAFAHRGTVSEIRRLLRLVVLAGLLLVVGSVVEIAAAADALAIGWANALTDGSVASALLRFLAGSFLILGFVDETVSVGGLPGAPDSVPVFGRTEGQVRWVPGAASAFGFAGAMLGATSFAFDGHTVTEGPRLVHALVNVVHVGAAGVWGGGVIGLAALGIGARRRPIAETFDRFSQAATIALGPVVSSGVVMAFFVLDDAGDLFGTSWGRALIVKSTAVAVAVAIGAYHHRVASERRRPGSADRAVVPATVLVEAAVILAVVLAAGVLARASTV